MAVIKKSDGFNVLLSAAMALPGMPAIAQDAGVRSDRLTVDFSHAMYEESGDRMQIDVDQLSLTMPVASRYEIGLNIMRDAISGASPVLYLADAYDDQPVMIKQAGASIKDTRDVLEFSAGFYGDKNYLSATVGHSEEDDYEADFAGIDYIHYLNDKNTNLLLGYARSDDKVWNVYFPHGSASFDPFLDKTDVGNRQQDDFRIGVDQLLDMNSHLLLSVTSVNASGDMSDPYKKSYVQGEDNGAVPIPQLYESQGGTPEKLEEFILRIFENFGVLPTPELRQSMGVFDDTRPDERKQLIYLARYSRYLEFADAALHLDYRFVDDDWGARSETVEFAWSQSLPWGFIITPGVRYYSQESADFYQPVYAEKTKDNLYSSDYRLAGFGAWSYKLAVEKTFSDRLGLRLSYEKYEREYDLAWSSSSVGTSVDDYSFELVSFSVGYGF